MKISLVYFKNGRAYVKYIRKSGKAKGLVKRIYGKIITCRRCGKEAFASDRKIAEGYGKYCSHKCGKELRHQKPGRDGSFKSRGYIKIFKPLHPYCDKNGYVFEHRLVMEKQIGRYLYKYELVHHINKKTGDNRIANLMLFNNDGAHRNFDKGLKVDTKYIVFDGSKI